LLSQMATGQIERGEREEALKNLLSVQTSARRIKSLVENLLEFSEVDNDSRIINPIALDEVLDEAIQQVSLLVDERQAEIVREKLPKVLGDKIQMLQVFQNLIGNALKFNDSDKPKVVISLKKTDGKGEICIADNGIGIHPKFHEKIFEPFKRLHSKDKFEGSGIGLALCKKIIERHGGKIWVGSKPKEGAVFRFTLAGL